MATATVAAAGGAVARDGAGAPAACAADGGADGLPVEGAVDKLPRAAACLAEGVRRGWHYGAQVAVARLGDPSDVAEAAVGWRAQGEPMRLDCLLGWSSTVKPIMAIALAQLHERGLLDFGDPVAQYVPEFAKRYRSKEAVTLQQVLLHTAGFPFAGLKLRHGADQEAILQACIEADLDWPPGTRCCYHLHGWTVLAEVVRQVDGRPYGRYVREQIFGPLGMAECFVGMPAEERRRCGARLAPLYRMPAAAAGRGAPGAAWAPCGEHADPACADPGGGGCGPAGQLVRVFAALRPGTALGLSEATLRLLTAPLRSGMVDELQGAVYDWACLGAVGRVALAGSTASDSAIAHGGSQSSCMWCDPQTGWCCAILCNGKPGGEAHYKRMELVSTAVARDLAEQFGAGLGTAPACACA